MVPQFFELVRADIRERTRRRSFLVTLAGALYLGYAAIAGNIVMKLDEYRGTYNSAWIGTLISLSTSFFVSLAGFYVVKNAIERDRTTGVGQILAATPLGRHTYLLAKWLSNFAVLGAIVAVQLAAALVMQLVKGEAGLDPAALVTPSLLLTLPALLFVASLAVFFESARYLRGGFGNILFFFAWAPLIVLPMELNVRWFDIFGMVPVQEQLKAAVVSRYPDYAGGFSLNAGPAGQAVGLRTFAWGGLEWSPVMLAQRAAWIFYSLVPLAAATFFFDRFSVPAATSGSRKKRRLPGGPWSFARHSDGWSPRSRLLRLVIAELKLLYHGVPLWWTGVSMLLAVLCLTLPLDAVQQFLLPASWLWPVLLWSSLGVREERFGTSQILFSAPRFVPTQYLALAGAGVICSFAAGSGALVRFAVAGDAGALVSFAGGAVFIPALAIALAVWSRTSRAFEALYTVLWYIGPMNRVAALDFTGASAAARAGWYGAYFLAAGLLLLAIGYAARRGSRPGF